VKSVIGDVKIKDEDGYNPEDSHLRTHRRENLKSKIKDGTNDGFFL
jgi:hypothetical protein